MKICPTCKETYKDDDLNFCLSDGTTLIRKRTGVTTRHSRVNEIVAVVLLGVSVLIFLSLISWNSSDWSLNGTGLGGNHKTQNWIGVVGAVTSDVLFQSIGIIAPGTDKDGKPHIIRLYSIASPREGEKTGANNLSLTVKREPNGVCSNYVCDLKKGDQVQVTGPFGNSTQQNRSAGLVSSGAVVRPNDRQP